MCFTEQILKQTCLSQKHQNLFINCKLPGIVVAIVVKRISDSNFSSIESFRETISAVGYINRKHFMGFAQVQSPPGI